MSMTGQPRKGTSHITLAVRALAAATPSPTRILVSDLPHSNGHLTEPGRSFGKEVTVTEHMPYIDFEDLPRAERGLPRDAVHHRAKRCSVA